MVLDTGCTEFLAHVYCEACECQKPASSQSVLMQLAGRLLLKTPRSNPPRFITHFLFFFTPIYGPILRYGQPSSLSISLKRDIIHISQDLSGLLSGLARSLRCNL